LFDTLFGKYLFFVEGREDTSWIEEEEGIWSRTQNFFFWWGDAAKAGGNMSSC
jgi:hypothetical protein